MANFHFCLSCSVIIVNDSWSVSSIYWVRHFKTAIEGLMDPDGRAQMIADSVISLQDTLDTWPACYCDYACAHWAALCSILSNEDDLNRGSSSGLLSLEANIGNKYGIRTLTGQIPCSTVSMVGKPITSNRLSTYSICTCLLPRQMFHHTWHTESSADGRSCPQPGVEKQSCDESSAHGMYQNKSACWFHSTTTPSTLLLKLLQQWQWHAATASTTSKNTGISSAKFQAQAVAHTCRTLPAMKWLQYEHFTPNRAW